MKSWSVFAIFWRPSDWTRCASMRILRKDSEGVRLLKFSRLAGLDLSATSVDRETSVFHRGVGKSRRTKKACVDSFFFHSLFFRPFSLFRLSARGFYQSMGSSPPISLVLCKPSSFYKPRPKLKWRKKSPSYTIYWNLQFFSLGAFSRCLVWNAALFSPWPFVDKWIVPKIKFSCNNATDDPFPSRFFLFSAYIKLWTGVP